MKPIKMPFKKEFIKCVSNSFDDESIDVMIDSLSKLKYQYPGAFIEKEYYGYDGAYEFNLYYKVPDTDTLKAAIKKLQSKIDRLNSQLNDYKVDSKPYQTKSIQKEKLLEEQNQYTVLFVKALKMMENENA